MRLKLIPALAHLLFLSLLLSSINSWAEEEFLRPEKAFDLYSSKVKTDPTGKHYIEAKWKIADGYYLYKNKTSFNTDNKEIKIETPKLPAGKMKHDEFFGDVEVYTKNLQVNVPISSKLSGQDLSITAKTQGCADAGICYPPLRQTINFSLPDSTAITSLTKKSNAVSLLSGFANANDEENEFVDPEIAFRLNVETNNEGKVIARWDIKEGYYLYKDKFKFSTTPKNAESIGGINFPKAKQKSDEFLGDYQVYDKQVALEVPLQVKPGEEKNFDLNIQYQGCAESGICYPLQKKTVSLDSENIQFAQSKIKPIKNTANNKKSTTNTADIQLSEQDALADYLSKGNQLLILLTFFGLGLALAFTPCVFPMIPILSGIIAGQSDKVDTKKGLIISIVYVLSMALTYTIAGVIAGLSGDNIQIWFQNPWVLGSFAMVFVLLALSMFGFYQLQLPSSLQSKITELSNKQKGGSYIGVIIMGFLSALIVGPCVAPPLMGALIYISQTGDPFLGGAALFVMSLGMGVPLIIIGASAGKFLPRAGVWMDAVKATFGVMMLGVAIWMLERVLPGAVTLWLWSLLLIFSAVYIGALTPIHDNTTGWGRFWKSLGIVMLVYGIILMLGASAGNSDLMQPLKGLSAGNSSNGASNNNEQHLNFKTILSSKQLDSELKKAHDQGKQVMLDYYADWCISCIELEKYTFADAKVIKNLQDFVLLQADVTADNEDSKQLLKKYQLIGPPAILFFNSQGEEVKNYRLVGFKNAVEFNNHISKFKSNQ